MDGPGARDRGTQTRKRQERRSWYLCGVFTGFVPDQQPTRKCAPRWRRDAATRDDPRWRQRPVIVVRYVADVATTADDADVATTAADAAATSAADAAATRAADAAAAITLDRRTYLGWLDRRTCLG